MAVLELSWPAVLSLSAGVLLVALANWIWRFRDRPGATHWAGVQVAAGVWALSYGVGLLIFDPTLRWLVEPLVWFGRVFSPPLILLFVLEYTGRGDLVRSAVGKGVVGLFVLAYLFYMTNPIHHLAWTGYRIDPLFGAAAVTFTPVGVYVVAALAYVVITVAMVLLLGTLVRYGAVFTRQIAVVVAGIGLPSVANVAWLFRLGPTAHLDLTAIMFVATGVAGTYALFGEEMFEVLPATARIANDIAIDDIETAIVTLSPAGLIVDYNEAAGDLFRVGGDDRLGQPIDELVAFDLPLAATALTVSEFGPDNRELDVTVSPIESGTGQRIGYVVTFYDITEERRQQERLSVQNRILRHNIRNNLDVVLGSAEQARSTAEERDVDRIADLMDSILSASEDLVRISEKARRFDEAVSDDVVAIDVDSVCRSVAAEMRDRHPAATVAVDDGTARVRGQQELLRVVVEELVENGIVHDAGETPHVRIGFAVAGPGDHLEITVADDGPGIPDHELAAIETGDEGPLSHGSGVGLWLVEWGVATLGGSLSFDTDGEGTTASIRLPLDSQPV